MRTMKGMLEKSKELIFADNSVTIRSALNDESEAKVKALAEELFSCRKSDEEETAELTARKRKAKRKRASYAIYADMFMREMSFRRIISAAV